MNQKDISQKSLFSETINNSLGNLQSQVQQSDEFQLPQVLDALLTESPEQSKINKVRQLLGEKAKDLSDDQLETFSAQLDYLLNCWLDTFEKQLFDGKTLREISEV